MEVGAIYENVPVKNRNTVGPRMPSQNPTEAQSSSRRGWFVPITACLGIFCVLMLVALILMYMHHTTERDHMNMRYMNAVEEYNETLNSLKINHSRLNDEREELQINLTSMSEMKLELETKVKNLSDALKSTLGSCRYLISNEAKTWSDSRQFCKDRGGDLIIINSEEEQRYISSFVKDRVWIGLSDIEKEGNMKWVDNTPLNKGFWYQGEPNDQNGKEDCVEILILSQNIMNWNDFPCTEKRKWICEN